MNENDIVFVFDTETDGMVNFKKDYTFSGQPHLVQFAGMIFFKQRAVKVLSIIVDQGIEIPQKLIDIHGISNEMTKAFGIKDIKPVLNWFRQSIKIANVVAAHNAEFDKTIMFSEMHRAGMEIPKINHKVFCTKLEGTNICKLPGRKKGSYKWPKLEELHRHLFNEDFSGAHDALEDVRATARCYFKIIEMKGGNPW